MEHERDPLLLVIDEPVGCPRHQENDPIRHQPDGREAVPQVEFVVACPEAVVLFWVILVVWEAVLVS